jgi:hypothetical protein
MKLYPFLCINTTHHTDYSISDSPEPDLKLYPFLCINTTHHTAYSISDSPEPDIKPVSISLHRYYTLNTCWLSYLPGQKFQFMLIWQVHPGAEVSTDISPQM